MKQDKPNKSQSPVKGVGPPTKKSWRRLLNQEGHPNRYSDEEYWSTKNPVA